MYLFAQIAEHIGRALERAGLWCATARTAISASIEWSADAVLDLIVVRTSLSLGTVTMLGAGRTLQGALMRPMIVSHRVRTRSHSQASYAKPDRRT
jgi:hypothetical protein